MKNRATIIPMILSVIALTLYFGYRNIYLENKSSENNFNSVKLMSDFELNDIEGNRISISNWAGQDLIINFWATWCAPCKEEMPSLDKLQGSQDVKIFPINVEKHDKYKSQIFFKNLKIKNLSIYFDSNVKLANLFRLTGVPTTIILNKNKNEIARILGPIDFSDQKFINWLNTVKE